MKLKRTLFPLVKKLKIQTFVRIKFPCLGRVNKDTFIIPDTKDTKDTKEKLCFYLNCKTISHNSGRAYIDINYFFFSCVRSIEPPSGYYYNLPLKLGLVKGTFS